MKLGLSKPLLTTSNRCSIGMRIASDHEPLEFSLLRNKDDSRVNMPVLSTNLRSKGLAGFGVRHQE